MRRRRESDSICRSAPISKSIRSVLQKRLGYDLALNLIRAPEDGQLAQVEVLDSESPCISRARQDSVKILLQGLGHERLGIRAERPARKAGNLLPDFGPLDLEHRARSGPATLARGCQRAQIRDLHVLERNLD